MLDTDLDPDGFGMTASGASTGLIRVDMGDQFFPWGDWNDLVVVPMA